MCLYISKRHGLTITALAAVKVGQYYEFSTNYSPTPPTQQKKKVNTVIILPIIHVLHSKSRRSGSRGLQKVSISIVKSFNGRFQ